MSSSQTDPLNNKNLTPRHHSTTAFRWTLHGRRRRLPTVRLGGKKPRRGFFLVRLCRRVKLKWLRVKYLCMLKKLKGYYDSFVREMVEGTGTLESFQQRMLLETSFAIPVMGLSFSSYPSSYALDRPMV